MNHAETEYCVRAERSFLKTLEGGCSIPAFGYAHMEGDVITLKGGIISLDGQKIVKAKDNASPHSVKELGETVAREVLRNGGGEILKGIRNPQGEVAAR